MEKEGKDVEHHRNFKKTVETSIKFVTIFFGNQRDIEFYEERIREFLEVFYDDKLTDFLLKFIYFERYKADDYKPITRLENWIQESRESTLNSVDLIVYSVQDILNLIVSYDLRTSLVMLYILGFLPQFPNARSFVDYYNVAPNFLDRQASIGFSQLFSDIKKKKKLKESSVEELVNRIDTIVKTSLPKDLLRYTNGELMPSGRAIYQLARKLTQLDINNIEKLNENETKLIAIFTERFDETYEFTAYSELVDRMGLHHSTVTDMISNILSKIENNDLYELRTDGVIMIMNEEAMQVKLIRLLQNEPELIQSDVLNLVQRKYLELYFSLKRKGVYISYPLLAEELGIEPYKVYEVMELAYTNLTKFKNNKSKFYMDHKGYVLNQQSARMKLLDIYRNTEFRKLLKENEVKILDLFMEREGIRFTYSIKQIAEIIGTPGEKGEDSVNNYISRLIRLKDEMGKRYVDQKIEIILRSHLEVIRLLQNISINNIDRLLLPFERKVAELILCVDNSNRYLSYSSIAEQMEISVQKLRIVVRRILEVLGNNSES